MRLSKSTYRAQHCGIILTRLLVQELQLAVQSRIFTNLNERTDHGSVLGAFASRTQACSPLNVYL